MIPDKVLDNYVKLHLDNYSEEVCSTFLKVLLEEKEKMSRAKTTACSMLEERAPATPIGRRILWK